jgi:hypothetical protein
MGQSRLPDMEAVKLTQGQAVPVITRHTTEGVSSGSLLL